MPCEQSRRSTKRKHITAPLESSKTPRAGGVRGVEQELGQFDRLGRRVAVARAVMQRNFGEDFATAFAHREVPSRRFASPQLEVGWPCQAQGNRSVLVSSWQEDFSRW